MKLPLKRSIIPLASSSGAHNVSYSCRVLQFNLLADGLSGLREDLGAFSRIKKEDIVWDARKKLILNEILQYDPDIITVQECDHFEDYFQPLLEEQGYEGVFAEKPNSPCLEVNDHGDGCAIFVRTSRFVIVQSEVLRYTMSLKERNAAMTLASGSGASADSSQDDTLKPQNQLAIILKCDVIRDSSDRSDEGVSLPPLVIATTHLKATKSAEGEAVRCCEMRQLLAVVDQFTAAQSKPCALLLTGDFNACPSSQQSDFRSITLELIRGAEEQRQIKLRSVYNDDLVEELLRQRGAALSDNDEERDRTERSDIWTTWKGRVKESKDGSPPGERLVKQCIDYILYQPPTAAAAAAGGDGIGVGSVGVVARGVLSLFEDDRMRDTGYLPSSVYPSDHIAIAADLDVVLC